MKITPEISVKIKKLIQEFVNHPQDSIHSKALQTMVAKFNIFPLTFNFFSCYCINLNGEIILFDSEYNVENKKITEKRLINLVLCQGIKKYPELKELMPIRSENDINCSHCNGTGIEPLAKELNLVENIICWCGGLGWIPVEPKKL